MIKSYFIFLSLLISIQFSAQTDNTKISNTTDSLPKKYLDSNLKEMGEKSFFKKVNKNLYHYSSYNTNDTTFFLVQWSYYFNKFSALKKKQLNTYLSNTHQIDTTKIITIHYSDTLRAINSFVKRDSVIYLDNRKHRHLYSHKSFLKQNKKCLKEFKKNKHSNVYHFFRVNENHPSQIKNLKWYEDIRGSLYKSFNINIKTFRTAVIHPDGRYFIYNYPDTNKPSEIYEKLIRNKKWDMYYNEFLEAYK